MILGEFGAFDRAFKMAESRHGDVFSVIFADVRFPSRAVGEPLHLCAHSQSIFPDLSKLRSYL